MDNHPDVNIDLICIDIIKNYYNFDYLYTNLKDYFYDEKYNDKFIKYNEMINLYKKLKSTLSYIENITLNDIISERCSHVLDNVLFVFNCIEPNIII